MRILAIFGVLVIGAVLIFVGAGGAIWYTGRQATVSAENAPVQPPVAATVEPPPAWDPSHAELDRLALDKLRALLSVADAKKRGEVLGSSEGFELFARQQAANQSLVAAALANATDEQPAVRVLMQRAAHQILAEAYMNRVVQLNANDEFPSEAEIEEFYVKNRDTFVLPDRVHVWQIFFPLAPGATTAEQEALAAKASDVSASLRKGKTDFKAMVAKHSGHPPSRLNDGYMGLLKLGELLPEVRAAVDKLKPGRISEALRTDGGFHIIRRGEIVTGSAVDLAQLRPQIRRTLLQQAARQIRQAAMEKIVEKYPVALPDEVLEQWRKELLADATPGAAETAAVGSAQTNP